jgi:hypothetical protein
MFILQLGTVTFESFDSFRKVERAIFMYYGFAAFIAGHHPTAWRPICFTHIVIYLLQAFQTSTVGVFFCRIAIPGAFEFCSAGGVYHNTRLEHDKSLDGG